MKKICFITTISSTLTAFVVKTAEYLHENTDWDISFICNTDDAFEQSLPEYIHYYPVQMERGISIAGVKAMLEMKKIFKREKFDLIQYSTPNAALYASIAAKQVGCSLRNYHLMGLRYLGASGLGKMVLKTLEKITCHYSTSIECVSKSNMEMGIQEGLFPPEKVTVIWNGSSGGVDLNRFDCAKREQWRREVRKELGYSNDDFIYGFVGRITRDKGINELLEAYFGLHTDAKLFIIGQMEDVRTLNTDLMEKARQHPNIQFHDSVTDIERYFAAIDVLLLPSYREGFGNVVIEAAAMGTPAIVSDIPGPIDAIDRNKTAFVVPAKDADALAGAMRRIRTMDYTTMGQNAAKFAKENFDSDVLCEKILERKKLLLGSCRTCNKEMTADSLISSQSE